ncbi:arsenate reductase (thioredoxin) [Enterococcus malodoratus]|uniref:Arsenate reductase (Thioredoxin) n=1 Tax=Enterococcus malodoratus ATCC 43197 TaxID=1158601 RepID=R2PEX3_9ENTE|nr:arsenate reductase (thioredoxin) [Enterococcus malodoratus]EOH82897.1 arsenate reductase (thioredoxin) [Enterococcus malodoratus ATCC 43197]EOT63199.1 arsenate reductase (thioredoxin) [Enterococcus malodoratus ATCC 43197]SPX03954.1 arsenate reductase (glutaredoxin) [Enterococcus malodoratus]SPX04000.1 arsenate reductase (glutaredoxin) [Enterococcus malodoratus]STD70858.1 arsenate reductase (glutaredoxin) [Enterococcus malodoratus]
MKKIYFLCTGNSCRSQMAEGYGHKVLSDSEFEVRSAGIESHGLNPRAVKVMAEDGIDISKQTSDLIDLDFFNQADLIITLCGDAKDKCPRVPKDVEHIHWDLKDPAQATGTEEEILSEFRKTRDIIKQNIMNLR